MTVIHQSVITGDNRDESMGTISRTCEESVPLYLSIFEGINVNLGSLTASFLSRKIASNMPGCYNTGFPDANFMLGDFFQKFDIPKTLW